MDAQILFLTDGHGTRAALCMACERVWESLQSAERCCRCSHCQEPYSWRMGSVSHQECNRKALAEGEAKRLAEAELVPGYSGPFLVRENVLMTVDELREHYDGDDLPAEGYCVRFEPATLSADSILTSLSEDHWEGFEPEGAQDLEAAIDAFNAANAGNGTYWEDNARKYGGGY